jgi:N-acyl-phosphatidylethanolamine-hydrolysing phospholipase D
MIGKKNCLLIFLGFSLSFFMGCARGDAMRGGRPEHHKDGGFKNLHMGEMDKSFGSLLKMRFSGTWAAHEELAGQVPVSRVNRKRILEPEDEVQATWIGHSTYLIQVRGVNILTDPVFSERASPISWAGPKRYTRPALSLDELPPIHYVVISHNHYDHLDLSSVEALGNDPLWIVPLKNAALLESVGVTNVVELDWWESHEVGEWTFHATPVQHWSARGIFDRFECLWAGFAITHRRFRFFFAGDTGYNPVDFREIGKRLGPFDLALIPIGAYAPRWFMKSMHVNPAEAVQIHRDLRSQFSLAIHWGTFPLTAEAPGDPPHKLEEALRKQGIAREAFLAPPLGTTTPIPAPRDS